MNYPVACLRSTLKLPPASFSAYSIVTNRTSFRSCFHDGRHSRGRFFLPAPQGGLLVDLFRSVCVSVWAEIMDTSRTAWSSGSAFRPLRAAALWHRLSGSHPGVSIFRCGRTSSSPGQNRWLRSGSRSGLACNRDFRIRAVTFVSPDQQCCGHCRLAFAGDPIAVE